MSVTITKAAGVTMLTLTSDPKSSCPPLCQILGGLCYSPVCCSVSRHLRGIVGTAQSVLGALHIMVGLLNIGLGAILMSSGGASGWQMDVTGFPHWLGALFILFGIICILSEKFPSPCLVLVNVILNFSGIAFAITGIALYSENLAGVYLWSVCRDDDDYYYSRNRPTLSPAGLEYQSRCFVGKDLIMNLVRGIHSVAIVLCVLELCLVVSSFVLAIKSLRRNGHDDDGQQQSPDQPDSVYKPLLNEGVEA
ncbi:membrane-spanning 4-domains subfamily A member 8-like isoform X2 [Corythoichthys intestinalis]|nr:membrane-spanning 4-domains subfamily A member 8-like isoform X2 [Corythoichthys intestinalis]